MNTQNGSHNRSVAMQLISARSPRVIQLPVDKNGNRLKTSDIYGCNTFNFRTMKEKLPKEVFKKLALSITTGKTLDADIANVVAETVKEWAIDHGATHFCHWFQPQTGQTAEKHDSFIDLDQEGTVIQKFSGSQLIQSEPDASSFPSGGMRSTFEARGYTAWDPSSPMFLVAEPCGTKTLCIPSAFISYTGEALDEKTALLRSIETLSKNVTEVMHMIGFPQIQRIAPSLGAEQEYFLIDRAHFKLRPDLMMTGRTLVGAPTPKGQQLEDHYFGSIPERVKAFMTESEFELIQLGIPVKTRHNEVAPNQFETAPIFTAANIAADHNQIFMEVLAKVAARHHFAVLLHEKPFKGVNGSGKHCNWSMAVTSSGEAYDGDNLLNPGKTPSQNLRFLLTLTACLKAMHKHQGLMRAAIASAGNDHRLGANEAPPAIISAFLGSQLAGICDQIEKGALAQKDTESALIQLGVAHLPKVSKDSTDRNRTSPFAFTGNKFEFRAVGAAASTSLPVTFLNAAVADAFSEIATRLKQKGAKPGNDAPVIELIRELIIETKSIRFEGNGYSEDWVKEAAHRGLLNLRKTPEALAQMVSKSSIEMISRMGIYSEAELVSHYNVRVERYVKELHIEAETLKTIVDTQILPAAYTYHGAMAGYVAQAKSAGVAAPQSEPLSKVSALISGLQGKRAQLEVVLHKAESYSTEEDKAKSFSNDVVPAMEAVRSICDELESLIGDDYWPLPKYREMLASFS